MPQTQILGGGTLGPGAPLAVDPTFLAARIALRPLEYTGAGQVLGHYAVSQASGATVSISANTTIGSLRWADASRFLVLMRVKAGWSITGATTTATIMDLRMIVGRSFSVDYTTNTTTADMASTTNTNKMRSSMGPSIMGVNGPRICTTLAMTGATVTSDAAPVSLAVWPSLIATNGTGTVVTQQVGMAGQMMDVYCWTALGQHPIVLSNNEGILLQPATAGPTSGTVKYYFQWEWAEVVVF